jgi:hypothetical protein
VTKRVATVNRDDVETPLEVHRVPKRCTVQLGPVALTLSWVRTRPDTVATGRLMIIEWEGPVGRPVRAVARARCRCARRFSARTRRASRLAVAERRRRRLRLRLERARRALRRLARVRVAGSRALAPSTSAKREGPRSFERGRTRRVLSLRGQLAGTPAVPNAGTRRRTATHLQRQQGRGMTHNVPDPRTRSGSRPTSCESSQP